MIVETIIMAKSATVTVVMRLTKYLHWVEGYSLEKLFTKSPIQFDKRSWVFSKRIQNLN
jgi:membrane protein YdbS with pleckstrin-like domain